MNKIVNLFSAIILFAAACTVSSCKKSFDSPPGPTDDVNIVANTSIDGLKAYHTTFGQYDHINTDIIISGIVVADDRSGNLYKQLFIQDTTGAIQILIDANSLYGTFPVGRKVYIKCNGLTLTDYHGVMELGIYEQISGVPSVEGIPSSEVSKYVIGGSINNTVTPLVVTDLNELNGSLNNRYINALIQLDGFEFAATDTAYTYADTSAYKNTLNRNIKNCANAALIVRNSAYANFAAQKLPQGNGSITSIYTVYKSTATSSSYDKQLLIRDTSDIKFYGPRCGSTPPPAGTRISIADLRALYTGSNIKITTPTSIEGVVISDATNKNVGAGVVILQQGNSGVSIYFGGTITYNIGDSIVLDITNDSLLNYRGSIEIKTPFGTTPPGRQASGIVITPQVKTIAEINSALSSPLNSPANFEYTLVKVLGGTASGGTTYAGNRTLTDASGTMTLYTTSVATFAGSTLPTVPKNWTGYANNFNATKELQVRNLSDVQ